MENTGMETVLVERAERLAKRGKKTAREEKKLALSIIHVGPETFGIPTTHLSCIIKSPSIASMPGLSPWLRGITQIRGELVGVVDIAIWFGLSAASGGTFMAVVEEKGRKLGILLDSVGSFRYVGPSDIAETFSETPAGGHPIQATTKDLATILDIPRLFQNPDMLADPVAMGRGIGPSDVGNGTP